VREKKVKSNGIIIIIVIVIVIIDSISINCR